MTEYVEEDFLQLSGLQHFLFCRRQWALIHVEAQWQENFWTVDGDILHERTHDEALHEKRGDLLTARGVRIFSRTLGVSGQCDVLEFHRGRTGISLPGREGLWSAYPVEYKRGEPKKDHCDAAQLCGQAMCLEEMLCCEVPEGALFYGETRRRERVGFTPELREEVRSALEEMHALYRRGSTPAVKRSKRCASCSLHELCVPGLERTLSVADYLAAHMGEAP